MKIKHKKKWVIHNAINKVHDVKEWSPNPIKKILTISNFQNSFKKTAFLHLLEVIQKNYHEKNKIEWTIIGNGATILTKEIKLQNEKIQWHFHEKLPKSLIEKQYNENDVFLYASAQESFGMVILEAKSHGLPTLLLPYKGFEEIAKESIFHENTITKILIQLLQDKNFYEETSKQEILSAKKFLVKNIIEQWESFINEK